MFLASFPAGPFQTNCYLIAPAEGADVVVIDPGMTAAETVIEWADAAGVGVAGVLLTHGHIDHVASAADVADHYGVTAWIHEAERELLDDAGPILPSSMDMARELRVKVREPQRLEWLTDGQEVAVGGLTFRVHHAPGHRPGCVMLSVGAPRPNGGAASEATDGGQPAASTLLFTGDVLFAGSIGRTDLPGGEPKTMLATLQNVVLGLPDEWVVLPGHGPETTIGRERATNPYLQPSFLR